MHLRLMDIAAICRAIGDVTKVHIISTLREAEMMREHLVVENFQIFQMF